MATTVAVGLSRSRIHWLHVVTASTMWFSVNSGVVGTYTDTLFRSAYDKKQRPADLEYVTTESINRSISQNASHSLTHSPNLPTP